MSIKDLKKKSVMWTLLCSIGLITACDSSTLGWIDPGDDTFISLRDSQGIVQVIGFKRIYELVGDYNLVTSKGRVKLTPGECMELSTNKISLFPIKYFFLWDKKLQRPDIEKEEQRQEDKYKGMKK